MNVGDCLTVLADPYAQDRWEHAYDQLDNLPTLSSEELMLVLQMLKKTPLCDYSLVRFFCLDLLDKNSIKPSAYRHIMPTVIEQGNQAERSMAINFIRSASTEIDIAIAMLENVDTSKLSFFARWSLRRLIKQLRKKVNLQSQP